MAKIKHGLFLENRVMPRLYKIWVKMKQRCLNPNDLFYKNFGGKGIRVCDKWLEYDAFNLDLYPDFKRACKKHGESNVRFFRVDDKEDFKYGNVKFTGKDDYLNYLHERQSKKKYKAPEGKISGFQIRKRYGEKIAGRIKRGFPEKYLFYDKIPYEAKKNKSADRKSEMFKKIDWNGRYISARDLEILNLRFGVRKYSPSDICEKYGITRQRIYQIENKHLKK